MMDLAMMGSGTGAIIEERMIKRLPVIRNRLKVDEVVGVGGVSDENRHENTYVDYLGNNLKITVGDSRRGWIDAYTAILEASSELAFDCQRPVHIRVDLSHVRPAGQKLKGFGGTSNPIKLENLFYRISEILNGAFGRQLTSVECCLLLDEAATVVVAGNIRRSAGMRQFNSNDIAAASASDNLGNKTLTAPGVSTHSDIRCGWRITPAVITPNRLGIRCGCCDQAVLQR